MAIIKSFRALRPPAAKAQSVSCVPYDVVYESEVRDEIENNPLTFLRVTRAEGDFPDGSVPDHEKLFAHARENLHRFIEEGNLVRDTEEAIYIYRLSSADHSQTGIVACCSINDYDAGRIKKHEKTRPDKVMDRTDHMLAVGAQTGLIFLAFRNTSDVRHLIKSAVKKEPVYDFDCPKGIRQTVWRITETGPWVDAFFNIPAIYIADGHHRAESAKLARDIRRDANPDHNGSEEYNYVVAGIFPAEDLKILPYNRVVKDLNGLDRDEFLSKVRQNFIVGESIEEAPKHPGEFCMYFDGEWFKLRFNSAMADKFDTIGRLDVSLLQNYLLGPVLGIQDPRTDERIAFVGGGRGTAELKKMVDEGSGKVAFSLYPTTMYDLFAVSDIDEIMPPKSTWFEPKLKDGLLVHEI
ncbi:DUF1015 family protein [soil metagenome]